MQNIDISAVKKNFRIIGNDNKLNEAVSIAVRVAPTDSTIVITGESGVGKDVFARIIHQNSRRKQNNYVAVNCAAIPEGTIESELFGHIKGSFTGADKDRKGYFAEADKGTIFLDEIGELPITTQSKLLRILENGEIIPVGSSKAIKVDVRVVAATNVNLYKAVEKGKFREDLYYRLNQVVINVPSLRERREDIPLLFRYFSREHADKYQVPRINLSQEATEYLKNYRWKGNVRELKNIAERISILEMNRDIDLPTLQKYIPILEKLPILSEQREETSENRDDIIRMVLQNHKDVLELRNELEQLKNFVRQLLETTPIQQKSLLLPSNEEEEFVTMEDAPTTQNLKDLERTAIIEALERNNGKRGLAAKELGFSERTLYRKITEYGLNNKD
ncbi:MAG: sigma-54 dependent transcriptional regulator [Bacteroidales bacterium]|jgi:transcriptional regulator with PAS, ATPase and Fis domain|nr:sigma-54 dependent transcriptional regulator [Bacteroidales bacterium]MEE0889954.1 sigma-54 dependent transcriptional regulator [Bacteroidales bacterium]MEE1020906.1 sigma-54 dependent transcriptional regulator [Bacteroidales bacterium]MEE1226381.1 sigma-54 dependent transcriptional regulator [Bacteroidales bacterium]MEE1302028.1 sigma-54 dependent transcriptional regulator [Bacteroidales bacterium]